MTSPLDVATGGILTYTSACQEYTKQMTAQQERIRSASRGRFLSRPWKQCTFKGEFK